MRRTSDRAEGAFMEESLEPFGYLVKDGEFNIPFISKESALSYMREENISISRKTLHPIPMEKYLMMGERI